MKPFRKAALVALTALAAAEIELNQLFSDGMVLQTNTAYGARAFLYGSAVAGETLQISGLSRRSAKGIPYPVVVGDDGKWALQLDPQSAGLTSYNMTIRGSASTNTVRVGNIVYGDVVLCSGQSNMVRPMNYIFNSSAEMADAANWPNIQLFRVPPIAAATPQQRFNTTTALRWQTASPQAVSDFSAVCYLTARNLARVLGSAYPLGLIEAAVGGTSIDRWTPPSAARSGRPGCDLFNGMISPAAGFSLKLMLFYQGESDSYLADVGDGDYAGRFGALINGWRDLWGMGDIAFVYAQLAPNPQVANAALDGAPGDAVQGFPELRLAQAAVLPVPGGSVDTTGMAVTIDLGDVGNLYNRSDPASPPVGGIHPRRKAEVARRMALQALHVAYARQVPGPSQVAKGIMPPYNGFADGPTLASATATGTANAAVTLTLGNAAGLALTPTPDCNLTHSSNGIPLALPNGKCCADDRTFELRFAGDAASAPWHASGAVSLDAARGTVTIALAGADAGKTVASVRYAYSTFPSCVLVNSNAIPLGPFVHSMTAAAAAVAATAPAPATAAPTGVALTPPMGFNSWNYYHCNIDERAIYQIADALIEKGLAQKGYTYVNIDDCWQVAREPATDAIVPDPARFPSGMKAIADSIHARTFAYGSGAHYARGGAGATGNMLFGIYTAAHGTTCQTRPGSYLNETLDAETYCNFGIDYLKIDQCGGDSYEKHGLPKNTSWVRFKQGFAACLARTGRPIVESVESCGSVEGCGEWIANSANLWRTGGDLEATWASIIKNADTTLPLYPLAGPSHWNDPDMLQVGNVGLTATEQKSHMAMWCFLAAPLLIGTDIFEATAETIAILGATELIAVDQDPLGFQGRVVAGSAQAGQVWGKKMADASIAVLLLNRADKATDITVQFADAWLPAGAPCSVRDLWAEKDLGRFVGNYTASAVPSHGNVALRISGCGTL